MAKKLESMLAFYQDLKFNPVLIQVEDGHVWQQHFAKRRNLYERHLGLPLGLMRGARLLEFGPCSGENCLVPALFGARLTLVEPNHQVLPRLHQLLDRFGVAGQIDAVHCQGIDEFESAERYDLVIAEGFLYTLPNREALLRKVARLVEPGRFGVISFNDWYGGVLELLRRAILFRACRLSGIEDEQGPASLELARRLYADDFAQLSASRSFDTWWRDTLVNPFYGKEFAWSFPEVLAIVEQEECEFYSSSPIWATCEHYNWYKNVAGPEQRRRQVLQDWRAALAYFVTGLRPQLSRPEPAADEVIRAVDQVTTALGNAGKCPSAATALPDYPAELDRYLAGHGDPLVRAANLELRKLFEALQTPRVEPLLAAYAAASTLRCLWGTSYSYFCFQRRGLQQSLAAG